MREVQPDDAKALAEASLLVLKAGTPLPTVRRDPIVAIVGDGAEDRAHPADLRVDPDEPVEQMVAQFRLWLPPDGERLVRMEAMFGREALMPLVQGLRVALQQAIARADQADAHKMAGLAGTLGFAAASASWQAVDQGTGDRAAALRDSRTALVAINRWLA
ncbi:hypothetical protein [Sphingobium sp. Z007]|uniref:hypothetical protein n=1 Tax=Sphingobium sp. Z007 TaxID=627495 RepID=UPI000B49EB47|nr:hypothetical protein [Sphingobium sp. Z007]